MGGNGTIANPCFEKIECDENEEINPCASLNCYKTCDSILNYLPDECPKNVTDCIRGCQCIEGYARDSNGSCIKSEDCLCNKGYEHILNQGCVNLNECLGGNTVCVQNETCVDNDGSFDCICSENFYFDDTEDACLVGWQLKS